MKSPKLYTIRKLTLQNFINFSKEEIKDTNGKVKKKSVHKLNNNITLTDREEKEYKIKQQHNHLFRIIENNKTITKDYIPDVVFVDCKNNKNYPKELDGILRKGIIVNGVAFKYWGKSASMSRNGILGFVSVNVYDIVESHAMMDIKFDKTVLSKFEAYKCLLLSSCFCIEEPLPYMIVVDDFEDTVKDVNIKYVDEKEIEYIDKKTNETKIFKEKIIKEGIKDVDICFNDGSGFISLEYANKIKECLQLDYVPSAEMLRIPYTKGLGLTVDFKGYYKEHNIEYLTDLWGKKHKVEDIDVVLTKSQYKGYKYFKKKGDYSDWEGYLALLKKYNYCMGIAKVNYSLKDEPKMTRCNYQTLQTLDITAEELIEVSSYTRKWIERILNGDLLYVYKYLGISENTEPINDYMKAIILNPQMINDIKVKSYLYGLLRKTIDEVKIGKIHIKGAFKFLIPDVIMMLEYIGGLKVKGCLKSGEMFAVNHSGEYVLNRNPHLSRSEHVILNAVNNKSTNRWCGHLEGCCMINSKDVTAPRLNGAD